MNERIRELAVKSGAFCEDEFGRLISWGIEGTELTDEVQKFAELIIKECTSMLEKEMNEAYGARGDGLADAIEMINKHFGVE